MRDQLPDQPPKECAAIEGGDDYTTGNLAAKCYDSEEKLGESTVYEPKHVASSVRHGFTLADPVNFRDIAAVNKQIFYGDVASIAGQWIGILKKSGGESDQEDFEDRVALNDMVFAEGI